MRQRHFIQWILLAAVMSLPACSGLLESPLKSDRTYMLQPIQDSQGAQAASPGDAFTLKLRVVPGLDTSRMVTVSGDAELNHFAAARWPDNLPEFSRSLIERSLRAHGLISAEHTTPNPARDECELKLEIEKFYTLLDQAGTPSTVQVKWDGYYLCGSASLPLRASESVQVGQKDINGVVRAYQQAFDLAMRSTIDQLNTGGAGQ